MKLYIWPAPFSFDGATGRELFRAPLEAIEACSASGPVDDAVAHWRERVQWAADDAELRRTLREYGAWDDLDTCDTDTLRERTLFVGCGAMADDPDFCFWARMDRGSFRGRA